MSRRQVESALRFLAAPPPSAIYWALLVLVFARAIFLRASLPHEPIADPDSWGFLSPALGAITGTGWEHHQRNYLYPTFLFLLLRVSSDFRFMPVAQHAVGLAAGAVFLLVWEKLRRLTQPSPIPRDLHRIAGLCAVAVYLCAPQTMAYEMAIRPEGVVSLMIMINLWLALEFSARCWLGEPRELPVALGAALFASTILLILLKPSFVIAALGSSLPIVIAIVRPFPETRKQWLAIACGVVGLVLLLPEQIVARSDAESRIFLPTQLFMIHAGLIRNQMAADLQGRTATPYPRPWLQDVQARLDRELKNANRKNVLRSLGFSPDYLMFAPGSFNAQMHRLMGGDLQALSDFYRFYYLHTWREQPARMLGKVATQMAIFYSPVCPAYHLSKIWRISVDYAESLEAYHSQEMLLRRSMEHYKPFALSLQRTASLAKSGLVLRSFSHSIESQRLLAKSFLGCLFVTVVLGLFVLFAPRVERRLRIVGATALFLCWYNFANSVAVAVVHTLDNVRYDRVQLIFTALAQLGALWLLAEIMLAIAGRISRIWRRCIPPKTANQSPSKGLTSPS